MIAADPYQGGATWAVLQYLLGLQQLGHHVYFVEPLPAKAITDTQSEFKSSSHVNYFCGVVSEFGLSERAALLLPGGKRETVGMSYDELHSVCAHADLLLNVAGMLTERDLIADIPCRVYLDLDPAFVQLWATQGIDMRFEGHTHFVTVGLALGSRNCTIPECGRRWITTLQPVVLDHWPVADEIGYNGLTTVGNWRGYGSVEHQGQFLGQKAHSLREFLSLPNFTNEQFILAMAIHPDEVTDLAALRSNGWQLLDPRDVAGSPADYRRFIQESKAEFGIAKSGYVKSCSGWFSDRSACYLASGRPVIAQDTGFSRYLPTGDGLFAFDAAADVLQAIDALNDNYDSHARAARRIAQSYFASDKVLANLLQSLEADL
jgi:hypothetical protein